MRIRQVRPEEATDLAVFGRRLFWEAYQGFTTDEKLESFMDQRYTSSNFLRLVTDSHSPTFLAEDQDWLGYASVDLNRDRHPSLPEECKPAYLSLLYVDQRYQGHGTGAKLLENVCHAASKRGCDYLWLSVWKVTKAPGFYRRMGFEEIGEIAFTYPDGSYDMDWVMGKWI